MVQCRKMGRQARFSLGTRTAARAHSAGRIRQKIKSGCRQTKSARRKRDHRSPTTYAQRCANEKQTLFVLWTLLLAYIPRSAANTLFSAQTQALHLISLAWLLLKLKQLGRVF
jgi:hypothetical protein